MSLEKKLQSKLEKLQDIRDGLFERRLYLIDLYQASFGAVKRAHNTVDLQELDLREDITEREKYNIVHRLENLASTAENIHPEINELTKQIKAIDLFFDSKITGGSLLGLAFGAYAVNKLAKKLKKSHRGGNVLTPQDTPIVDKDGLKELPITEFAEYQQYLAGTPVEQQIQDLTTLGTLGKIGDAALTLGTLIPEAGPVIAIAQKVINTLIGVFYKPSQSIYSKLKDAGIDIFADDLFLSNPSYPELDDPHHFTLDLNGIIVNGADQARYMALIFYQKVLGFNQNLWLDRISPEEREYLFPSNDPQWPEKFEQLALIHGHANPYLLKKSRG
ncbi:MAG: hypothetical protein WCN88_05085 [Candidatus Falkowbacteria bacterium]